MRARAWAVQQYSDLEFVVLTDVWIPGVKCLPLTRSWPSWFSKMAMFEPGLFDHPVLYIDLDSLIVDRLDILTNQRAPALAMLSDFNFKHLAQSGVMIFRPGLTTAKIWKQWIKDPAGHMANFRGDGEWLHEHCKPQRIDRLYPGAVVSYKKHAVEAVPEGAVIVCGHGNPRPHDPSAGWMHEEWKRRVTAFGQRRSTGSDS